MTSDAAKEEFDAEWIQILTSWLTPSNVNIFLQSPLVADDKGESTGISIAKVALVDSSIQPPFVLCLFCRRHYARLLRSRWHRH